MDRHDFGQHNTGLTEYENEQIGQIMLWQEEEPSVVTTAIGVALKPVVWLVRLVVPDAAIRGALTASNSLAWWLTDLGDIARDAEVGSIRELRTKDLRLSDELADSVHNWAIGIAATEGGAAGFFGLPALAADIPALITLALRTVHKIGICYGYECTSDSDVTHALSVLAAAGANSVEEKAAAVMTLRMIETILVKSSWRKITEEAAKQQIGKEAAIIATRNLAKQLGVNLTKRKALAAVPVIGALIGSSANGWFIREVGWAARRCFQRRWLMENGKLSDPGF